MLPFTPFSKDDTEFLTLMGWFYFVFSIAAVVWLIFVLPPAPKYQVGEFAKTVVSGEVGQVIRIHCQPFEPCAYTLRVGRDTHRFALFEIMTTTETPASYDQE